jgi:hypothetical protein
MEPETSVPKFGPEQAPLERTSEHISLPSPESGLLESGAERTEQAAESVARTADSSGISASTVPTTISDDNASNDDMTAIAAPALAADDDLIEKEWVDRAKKIVTDTRDDPYQQETAVNALQKDYRKKRYGRELGEAN